MVQKVAKNVHRATCSGAVEDLEQEGEVVLVILQLLLVPLAIWPLAHLAVRLQIFRQAIVWREAHARTSRGRRTRG